MQLLIWTDPHATEVQLGCLRCLLFAIDWSRPQSVQGLIQFASDHRAAVEKAGASKKVRRKNRPEECVIH